jgi:hypothetical protein
MGEPLMVGGKLAFQSPFRTKLLPLMRTRSGRRPGAGNRTRVTVGNVQVLVALRLPRGRGRCRWALPGCAPPGHGHGPANSFTKRPRLGLSRPRLSGPPPRASSSRNPFASSLPAKRDPYRFFRGPAWLPAGRMRRLGGGNNRQGRPQAAKTFARRASYGRVTQRGRGVPLTPWRESLAWGRRKPSRLDPLRVGACGARRRQTAAGVGK